MHIIKLIIKNFLRFKGEFTLNLKPGCYAIYAEDIIDSTKSNGLSKCLPGDTFVYTNKGPIAIEEFVNKQYPLIYGLVDNRIVEIPVKKWFKLGRKKVVEIHCMDGSSQRYGIEHPILTPSGFKKAGELNDTDYIGTARKLPKHEYDSKYQYNYWDGVLAGLYVADGSRKLGRDSLGFTGELIPKIELFLKSLKKIIGTEERKLDKRDEWIRNIGLERVTAAYKRIPFKLFLNKEAMRGFIEGVWVGDGNISRCKQNSISYYSASKDLINDIRYALLRFDIRTRVCNRTLNNKIYYRLDIDADCKNLFYQNFPLYGYKKKDLKKLINALNKVDRNPNVGTVPYEVWNKYEHNNRSKVKLKNGNYKGITAWKQNKRGMSKKLLMEFEFPPVVWDNDIKWERVKKVTVDKEDEECYDIGLDTKEHAYIAGYSFSIVHNSGLLGSIKWCLRGKKDDKHDSVDDMISYGEDTMKVFMELSDGTTISREKTKNKSYALVVKYNDIEYKQDDAQEAIERAVGLSEEDMETTCWSEQGELGILAKTKSTKLTEMVESWLGTELEKLVEAGELVNQRLKQAVEYHSNAVEELNRLKEQGSDEELRRAANETILAKKDYENSKKQFEIDTKCREGYFERKALTKLIEERAKIEGQIEALSVGRCIEFTSDGIRITHLTGDLKYTNEELEKLIKEKEELLRKLSITKNEFNNECRRLRVLVQEEFDGTCPVSRGFTCPAVKDINKRGAQHQKDYDSVTNKYNKETDKYDTVSEELDTLKKSKLKRINEEKEIARKEGQIKQLETRLSELKREIIKQTKLGIKPLDDSENIPPSPTPPDTYRVRQAEEYEKVCREAQQAIPDAIKRVEDTSKEVRAHRLANAVLGPEGARRKVIEGMVSRIENDANKVLTESEVGQTVKTVWGRETGSLAEQCYDCGNAYPKSTKIKNCEKCGSTRGPKIRHEFKWRLGFVSGAGEDLGGLGLRIGAYRWKKLNRGTTWGVAILDEPTAQMDEFRRRALSACIQRLLKGTYEQSLITSHSKATLESCEHQILIKGKGIWSTVEVVQ